MAFEPTHVVRSSYAGRFLTALGKSHLQLGRRCIAVLLAILWIADYLRGVRRVRLRCGGKRSNSLLSVADKLACERLASICKRCPSLASVYWPTWYAPGALRQFLLIGLKELRARLLQRNPYIRSYCALRDGSSIALDWALPPPALAAQGGLPVVVLLHGAFMDSRSVTMSDLARDFAARGMPAVVMNRQGYGGVGLGDVAAPRLSLFGFDEDLDDVLEVVAEQHPGRLAAIVGFSCGSGFAGRYVGKRPLLSAWADGAAKGGEAGPREASRAAQRATPRLLCAVAYDPGYDVSPEGAVNRVRPPFSWVLNWGMKYFYAFRHRGLLRRKSRSFGQLVDEMISPRKGVVDTFRLGRRLSGVDGSSAWLDMQQPQLHEIQLPTLLINSRDDPICVWSNVEANLSDIKKNPNLVLAVLERGSHGCKFDFWGLSNVAHGMMAEFVLACLEELRRPSREAGACSD